MIQRLHTLANKVDLILVLLLSLTVRILTIGWHGLSYDEAQTVGIATLPTLSQTFQAIVADGNPPIFYFLVRTWIFFFGQSDFTLKLLVLLISGLLPPLVYIIVKKRLGIQIAIPAAVLTSLCPTLITKTNMLRPYGLIAILGLISLEELYVFMSKPDSKKVGLKYSLILVALMYTHWFSAAICFGHAFLMAFGSIKGWWKRNQLLAWFFAVMFAIVLFLPWLSLCPRIVGQTNKLWTMTIDVWIWPFITSYILFNLVPRNFQPDTLLQISFGLTIISLIGALFQQPQRIQLPEGADRIWLRNCHIVTIGALLFTCLGFFAFIAGSRYLTAVTVFILILFSTFVYNILGKAPIVIKMILPVLVWLPIWIPQLFYCWRLPLSSEYDAAKIIKSHLNPSVDLIVCACEIYAPSMARQFPAQTNLVAFPDVEKIRFINYPGIDERLRDEKNYHKLEELMQNTLKKNGKIWFLKNDNTSNCKYQLLDTAASNRLQDWLFKNAEISTGVIDLKTREAEIVMMQFAPKKSLN